MLYTLNQKHLQTVPSDTVWKKEEILCGFYPLQQCRKIVEQFQLPEIILSELPLFKASRFESHEGFDLMVLNRIDTKLVQHVSNRIFIYLDAFKLFIFCDDQSVLKNLCKTMETEESSFGHILNTLFKQITDQDNDLLEHLEKQITVLEDRLLSEKGKDYVREIIHIRKRLTLIKSHYDQWYNVLDGIQENENQLISQDSMRYFKIFSHKIDRLNSHTLNLRDYITQVREAYQSQVDISLNKTMKVLTVVTAIISPLTLIAGWYGMNLQMPEYHWSFGYPLVIGLSIAAIGLCIAYFKKHKWF